MRAPTRGAYLLELGETPYLKAWELQRSLAAAVQAGTIPDTVVLLEHPPVITTGRRTDDELRGHQRSCAGVAVVDSQTSRCDG